MLKRRILDYGLAGALLLVPVLILQASLKEPEDLNSFDQAVLRVSSPLQAAVSWVIEGVGGGWNRYVWLVDVEEENDELRLENRRLRLELAQATRRAADMEILEELVELRRRTPADTIGARVVAARMNPYFRTTRIRIDRGKDEVAVGMPVINQDGLVGRIGRVYGEYADVLLISDPGSSVEVYVQRTGSHGALRGLGRDDDDALHAARAQHAGHTDEQVLVAVLAGEQGRAGQHPLLVLEEGLDHGHRRSAP
jgi:rod shape-determining protein MreC